MRLRQRPIFFAFQYHDGNGVPWPAVISEICYLDMHYGPHVIEVGKEMGQCVDNVLCFYSLEFIYIDLFKLCVPRLDDDSKV